MKDTRRPGMSSGDDLTSAKKSSQLRPVVIVVCLSVLLLLALAIFSQLVGADISQITRDPLAVAEGEVYWGALSNLGVLIWFAGAAVALFAALLLRNVSDDKARVRFLVAIATLTAFLTLDDLFMFHERIWGRLTGLDEIVLYAIYAAVTLAIFVQGRKAIAEAPSLGLGISLLFFVLSLVFDKLDGSLLPMHFLFEDGAKFVGVACWTLFICQFSHHHVRKSALA